MRGALQKCTGYLRRLSDEAKVLRWWQIPRWLCGRMMVTFESRIWPHLRKYFVRIDHLSGSPSLHPGQIVLFCSVKNESRRLYFFLDYYRRLGVDSFFIIDNMSTDDTREILLAQRDVVLFQTADCFAKSRSGSDWIDRLIHRYAQGHWIVFADVDELLYFPYCETRTLKDLCSFLDAEGADCLRSIMVDMYPGGPLAAAPRLAESQDWLVDFPYFDPITTAKIEPTGGRLVDFGYKFRRTGGVRNRLFDVWPTLDKTCLFKYCGDRRFPLEGHHYYWSRAASDIEGIVLHFRLTLDQHENAEAEARERSQLENAHEYRAHAARIRSAEPLEPYFEQSIRFESSMQLVSLGYGNTSAAWDSFTPSAEEQ